MPPIGAGPLSRPPARPLSRPPAPPPAFSLEWLERRPFSELHSRFRAGLKQLTDWPAPERYDELARQVPSAPNVALPRFVLESRDAVAAAGGYEQHVALRREVPTRAQSFHDFFNMCVWAHFPKLRWALNALHTGNGAALQDPRNGRTKAQNRAASLDETGILVLSRSPRVLAALRALHFRHAFWELREELLLTTRFWIIGHGLLESLLEPHPRLAARGLLIELPQLPVGGDAVHAFETDELRFAVDALVAAHLETWRASPSVLDPIPVMAIPRFSDNARAAFYDEPSNLVFEPVSRRPAPPQGSGVAASPGWLRL
jgi:hypothetical protein